VLLGRLKRFDAKQKNEKTKTQKIKLFKLNVMNLIPVILCGGSGTRLWPLSRDAYPKQFHRFVGEHTLFEATVLRAASLPNVSRITIVCNDNHRFMAAQQAAQALASIGSAIQIHALLEPVARNTAPAIAAAAHSLPRDATMVVLPSDHYMANQAAFHTATTTALKAVALGHLCTFGIKPTTPETGYGYIESGLPIEHTQAHAVKRFVEKPNLATAQQLIATGTHTWNSGMFVMQAGDFLDQLAIYAPQVHAASQAAVHHAVIETDFTRLSKPHFEQCPSISVDYAVFERTAKAAVVAYHGDWSDLGSWASIANLAEQHTPAIANANANTNANSNDSTHVSVGSSNNHVHIYGQTTKPVALVGVSDLVIVDTPDALLITHKSASQHVKDALAELKIKHPTLASHHRKVHRPWGWYDSIDSSNPTTGENGAGHQVKRIHVYPGASLSLQSHAHRAEHWVVVLGTATIGIGADLASVVEQNYDIGQHAYIPLGHIHRLTNRTTAPVEIIEVQCGSYLGEDDIVRYQDVYGRT
jgi:mannose-1-phosphate guanylyltransferase/mannose-6-phosphate isomerase